MARFRTRAELRQRCKDESHRVTDTGAYNDASWNRAIANGWALAWHILTHSEDDAIGRASRDYVVTEASDSIELSAAFSELISIYRIRGAERPIHPRRITRDVARQQGWLNGNAPQRQGGGYWQEGPGQEYNDVSGLEESYPQRIRLLPALEPGEQLAVEYVSQEPSLGDPADPADDAIAIDVVWEPVERAVVAYARAVSAEREDKNDLARATADLTGAITATIESRGRKNKADAFDAAVFEATGVGW